MIKAGVVGLGRMGVSHLAVLNAHPDVKVVAVCDTSKFILTVMEKYGGYKCFTDFETMMKVSFLDCIVVATPTKYHQSEVRFALENKIHVFCEKPFCLDPQESFALADLAESQGLINQTGYHCRFVGVFQKVKELLNAQLLGEINHFLMEVYGNVVKKPEGLTWRSKESEGGGCLYDYASHGIDLVNYLIGKTVSVKGSVLKKIYSRAIEDAAYTTIDCENGINGVLTVDWCDASFRKMFNQITITGMNGKMIADRQEVKIFLRKESPENNLRKGWNILYTTDLIQPVGYYLRGEEYSAQIDYFVKSILTTRKESISSFRSAAQTDDLIQKIKRNHEEYINA